MRNLFIFRNEPIRKFQFFPACVSAYIAIEHIYVGCENIDVVAVAVCASGLAVTLFMRYAFVISTVFFLSSLSLLSLAVHLSAYIAFLQHYTVIFRFRFEGLYSWWQNNVQ